MLDILFGDEATKKIPKEPVYSGLSKIVDYGKDMMYFYVNQMISENDKQTALTFVIVIIIVTFMLKNLFNYLASFFIMHVRNGVMADLRKSMYKKIVSLPIGFYSEKRKGDVMARMLGDLGEVQGQFFAVLDLLVKDPLTILFSIVAMFMLSYKLMIFVFIFIPISGFVISLIGKSLKQQSSQAQQESGLFISMLEETLSGLKVVKSNNAENVFIKKFNDSIDRLLKLSNDIGTKNNLASPVSEFMGIVVIAVLLWYGGYLVMDEKSLKSSDFIAFMGLAYNILTPAKAISRASYSVKAGLAAAERVFHILDQHNPIADHQGSLVKTSFDNQVSFKNITFSYEEQIVLENFNLTIPKGKTYALVGQSGSGKSTIANLITRFYDVEHGTIEIDGINIKELKLDALRSLTGMVTQDSILFNDSIKNNILIGKPQASDAEVIEALKVANAWEFVKDLPKGIETNIGDAGSKLSGGQKQRLNIARTVLKNPPIMILDEATSALDTESEKVVQDALENMLQNRTSIVIAHRLSTIQNADCIVVMSRGKIVEQGTHDDLMNLENGYYARLVSLQSLERT
jgi:subfamily B ATP-binding cassette protein MsbA